MIAILRLLIGALRDYFKSRRQLQAEVLVLRHQINILRRQVPGRVRPTASDRAIFVWHYRIFADVGSAIVIVRPETIVRWHRMGFRVWWRWKSRNPGGRPKINHELRDLVRRMCEENALWGTRLAVLNGHRPSWLRYPLVALPRPHFVQILSE
jgi:hypothetical protein